MTMTRINEFQAAEGKAEALHEFLQTLVPFISSCKGCDSCEVLRSQGQPNTFVVIEKWQSIEEHKQAVENYPKEKMQAAMPLFGAIPKGDYYL